MTEMFDRLIDHALYASLTDLDQALSSAKPKADEVEGAPGAIARLEHVLQHLKRTLTDADPFLIPKSTLDNLRNNCQQMIGQVNAFAGDSNFAHLDQANDAADTAIRESATMKIPDSVKDIEAIGTAMEKFGKTANKAIKTLRLQTEEGEGSVEELKKEISRLQGAIKKEQTRIDTAVSQHQEQFSNAQDARQTEFNDVEKAQVSHFDKALNTWVDKFSALETTQGTAYEELLENFRYELDKYMDSSKETTESILKDIRAHRDKAKKIVGIISGTGMAGGYQRDANQERNAYYVWILGTISGFAGLLWSSHSLYLASLLPGSTDGTAFDWTHMATRSVLIVTFGFFVTFTGRMAVSHRKSERRHRHKQLALESMNPFIEDLDPEDRKKVKLDIADSFFVQHDEASILDDSSNSKTATGLMGIITELIKKIR